MQNVDEILALIPHRPPFLWVDKIVSCADRTIVTEKYFPDNLEALQGHFPGNPVTRRPALRSNFSGVLKVAGKSAIMIDFARKMVTAPD